MNWRRHVALREPTPRSPTFFEGPNEIGQVIRKSLNFSNATGVKPMSVLQGQVTQIDNKVSKKGNSFQRLRIEGDFVPGGADWFTSFADTLVPAEGAFVECSLKPFGDGEIIDTLTITGADRPRAPGNGSGGHAVPQAPAAPIAAPAASPAVSALPGTLQARELMMCIESFFKTMTGEAGTEDDATARAVWAQAVELALMSCDIAVRYRDNGRHAAAAVLRELVPGTVENKAAGLAARATAPPEIGEVRNDPGAWDESEDPADFLR